MKDALSTLFWRFCLKSGANWTFFFSYLSLFFLLFIIHPAYHFINVHFLSLSPVSGGAGRKCDSLGGRCSQDLLPPAELRWIDRGHPESPPTDPLLQRHARCVCVFRADKPNLSISKHLPLVTSEASLLNTLAMTHQHLHFSNCRCLNARSLWKGISH